MTMVPVPGTGKSLRRPFALTLWVLALAPWLWEAAFWLFVVRATRALGHWPRPSLDDPKDLGFTLHHYGLLLGLPFAFAATLTLCAALLAWPLLRREKVPVLAPWAVGVAGLGLILALGAVDPGNAGVWFAD